MLYSFCQFWPHRLTVRTAGFQSVNRSSILREVTDSMKNTQVIILAAGKGKRMESDLPKALTPLHKKTFIEHQLDRVREAGFEYTPIIVVGHKREQVMSLLGDVYPYAHQDELLGTGHATKIAKDLVPTTAETVVVLFADNPVVRPETIVELAKKRKETGAPVVMAVTDIGEWSGWQAEAFGNFGRIVRGSAGNVQKIIEAKDATAEELLLTEVNPGYFAFDPIWLWDRLNMLTNNNSQGEYYLVDLPGIATAEGHLVPTVSIEPIEALGANTKEQLKLLEELTKETLG
jgi:bifunctional UDP-N-acetylglucosamine pyrophosphorylase/glucosamine-1-phosphate N-acetyltransferase